MLEILQDTLLILAFYGVISAFLVVGISDRGGFAQAVVLIVVSPVIAVVVPIVIPFAMPWLIQKVYEKLTDESRNKKHL